MLCAWERATTGTVLSRALAILYLDYHDKVYKINGAFPFNKNREPDETRAHEFLNEWVPLVAQEWDQQNRTRDVNVSLCGMKHGCFTV